MAAVLPWVTPFCQKMVIMSSDSLSQLTVHISHAETASMKNCATTSKFRIWGFQKEIVRCLLRELLVAYVMYYYYGIDTSPQGDRWIWHCCTLLLGLIFVVDVVSRFLLWTLLYLSEKMDKLVILGRYVLVYSFGAIQWYIYMRILLVPINVHQMRKFANLFI